MYRTILSIIPKYICATNSDRNIAPIPHPATDIVNILVLRFISTIPAASIAKLNANIHVTLIMSVSDEYTSVTNSTMLINISTDAIIPIELPSLFSILFCLILSAIVVLRPTGGSPYASGLICG